MPDRYKHQVLAAAGFKIARTCGTCNHWVPSSQAPGYVWGHCDQLPYQHEKHSEEKLAGTPDVGTCSEHRFDQAGVPMSVGDDYAARYMPEDDA